MTFSEIFSCFMQLIYPENCLICGENLVQTENQICLSCLIQLPKTNYHLQLDNPVEKRFWGKIRVEHASSFCFFEKGAMIQKLMHELKYRDNREIGEILGKHFGMDLAESSFYQDIDVILPVPLHKNRYHKRGYNQSEEIAKGIAVALKKPVDTQIITRAIENPTQTKKGVFERWENTTGIFVVNDIATLSDKHILLVDDVLTTGSTLEACGQAILTIPNIRLSVVTLAMA
ncbi:MAG: ComF family protein [Prevotellaceae bacterium]|jgi:ComF family protein|nr:ComF family protein [Prevotellaceae bacterium]